LSGDPIWGGVVEAAYSFADALLGRLIQLAGADTSVWVVSPQGVRRVGGAMAWSRSGLIAARGRWIEASTTLQPASLVDIAPTVLARFGLTLLTDGTVTRPLAPGRSQRPVIVPPPPAPRPDRHVDRLRAAGYSDQLSAAQETAATTAEGTWLRGLGEALIERGQVRQAESALRKAKEKLPSDALVLRRLAMCAVLRGDAASCRTLGGESVKLMPRMPWGYVAVAAACALEGDAASAWPNMAKAEELGGSDAELLVRLGGVALMLHEDGSATRYFSRALELEPELETARQGLVMARELARGYESGDRRS
jgi:Flp pilus assembly protein TadD